MTTSEYGVGPLTVGTPVHIATASPAKLTEQTFLNTLTTNTTGANPPWGAVDPNAIYTLIVPEKTNFTSLGDPCCSAYYGFHDEITIGGQNVAYAIACACTDPLAATPLESLTATLAHEFVEAATDPFVQSAPAWTQTDDPSAAWSLITEGELADMCEFDGDQYMTPSDMTYKVQRSWSNKAAKDGKDPCLPLLNPPDVYFNSAVVVNDTIPVQFYGQTLMGKGVKIPVGQSMTVDVDLFSDGPTAGPWKLKVIDYNEAYGGPANLTFSLDKDTGMNGDVLKLTITVVAADKTLGAEPFWIESTLGNASNIWMGMVGQ